jgi:UDP-4-amino-4,6-dideoxy-N-acetyl-beta-L-altrosamine N-acetyltransferase
MTIKLRELEKTDLETLNSWRNDPELMSTLGNNFLFISGAVDAAWFENYLQNRDKAIRLSIITTPDNRYIGNVNLTNIHPINRSAEFSILIGSPQDRGKGAGRTATHHMLRHAFHDRGLNRIYLSVLKENVAALKLYEKMGLKKEGIKRQDIFKNGQFHDVVIMAMLQSEFSHDMQGNS